MFTQLTYERRLVFFEGLLVHGLPNIKGLK